MDAADNDESRRALERALGAIRDLRGRLDAAERAAREPIAVIGMGCRFPGGVDSPEAFWELLHAGRDAVGRIPADRWDVDAYFDPNPESTGTYYSDQGGFLADPVDRFDAAFFGISPARPRRSTRSSACCSRWRGRRSSTPAWHRTRWRDRRPACSWASARTTTATSSCATATRRRRAPTSAPARPGPSPPAASRMLLGLRGPTVSLDTACSSSLVATTLAVQSLRAGACRAALAGGVNLMLDPHSTVALSALRALSPTGRCHAFDEAADGYVRGEGCGLILLKRLSDAEADGDRILAVIRGAAMNHDGRSSGLTVPSGAAQREVLRAALDDAGLTPPDVDLVEAHGTGTPLGDPIEVRALDAVYSADRPADRPLGLTSVKTNIGHLEVASGAAGLIKLILALQHEEMPAQAGTQQPSAHIDWSAMPIELLRQHRAWLRTDRPRRAAVSGFGLSGTNAHVIVEEAPARPGLSSGATGRPVEVVTIAARDDNARRELARRYADAIDQPGATLGDLAWTAQTGRARFARRLAVVGAAPADVSERLRQWADGAGPTGAVEAVATDHAPSCAFLFTGQGAQLPAMGRDLYARPGPFRATMDACDELLRPYLDVPLLEVLYGDADPRLVHDTTYTQPALFAIELALATMWMAWGVEPAAVAGHSIGEYAAACVAGVMDVADAARLIALRGRLMGALPAGGRMVAVTASEDDVAPVLERFRDAAGLAAVNGPKSVVVSGHADAVDKILAELSARGVSHRALEVSHAFHSPLMAPMVDEFAAAVTEVELRRPAIPFVSTVTGEREQDAVQDPDYWRRHVADTVRFADAVAALRRVGVTDFLEVGPQPTLLGMVGRLDAGARLHPSLRNGRADDEQVAETLGSLWTTGIEPDWTKVRDGVPARRVDLPTYAFQRVRHWVPEAVSTPVSREGRLHPLVHRRLTSPAIAGHVYESTISAADPAFLGDHRLFGAAVVPATAHLEAALAAVSDAFGPGSRQLEQVQLEHALLLPDGAARQVQVVLQPAADGRVRFAVHALEGAEWRRHATGSVLLAAPAGMPDVDVEQLRSDAGEAFDIAAFYEAATTSGMEYGPAFRTLQDVVTGPGWSLGHLSVSGPRRDLDHLTVHPALLDGALQLLGSLERPEGADDGSVHVPVSIGTYRALAAAGESVWARAHWRDATGSVLRADVDLFDDAGRPVAVVQDIALRRVDPAIIAAEVHRLTAATRAVDDFLYDVAWQALDDTAPAADVSGRWLVVTDDDALAPALAAELTAATATAPELARPEDLETLLATVGPHSWGGVVASFRTAPSDPLGVDTVARLLRTAQALLASGTRLDDGGRFWLVTTGSRTTATEDAPADVVQAALWGFADSLAAEEPQLRVGAIDLAAGRGPGDAAQELVHAVSVARDEDRIAVRDGGLFVARLDHAGPGPESGTAPTLDRDGTYLVTGGLGGLGLAAARSLVAQGARHLVLVGRREPDAATVEALESLRTAGAEVVVRPADVGDRAAVAALLDSVRATLPPLRGVVHAAGVLDDGTVRNLDAQRLERALRPKLGGALHLDELTGQDDLTHFVVYSSAASLLGSAGQANYAAANAGLDALAHRRRALGRPGLSIDWGPWSEVGMAARLSDIDRQRIVGSGLGLIDPDTGDRIFGELLSRPTGQVGVLDADWAQLVRRQATVPPLLQRLVSGDGAAHGTGRDVAVRLEGLAGSDRRLALRDLVRGLVADVLGLSSDDVADDDQTFPELGLDSLMAVDLVNRLQRSLGVELESTAALELTTVTKMVGRLAELLGGDDGPDGSRPDGDVAAASIDRRTSTAQRRLLFIEQFVPDVPVHNIPRAARFTGHLDVAVLEAAFTEIVRRHEVLRTNFLPSDGDYAQRVVPAAPVRLPVVDLTATPASEVSAALDATLEAEAKQTFDLATDLKLRVLLVRVADDDNVVLVTTHHTASDGWSIGRLGLEVMELYAAAVEGRPAQLPELPMQYADYAELERQAWDDQDPSTGLAYWTDVLGGDLPVLALPEDRPRPPVRSYRGATVPFQLSADLMEAVSAFSRRSGTTPFVTLLASYAATLARFSGQDEVVVGTAAANRGRPETTALIGLFANTLALRLSPDPSLPFSTFVENVRTTAHGAFAHQDVPFDRIVEALRPERDLSRAPIFQTIFLYQNLPTAELQLPGLEVTSVPVDTGAFDLDIGVQLIPGTDGAAGEVRFNADVFEVGSVERLVEGWRVLLAAAVESPDAAVGVLPVVSGADVDRLLGVWGGSAVGVSAGAGSVVDLVRARVGLGPDVVAVRSGGVALSFAELDALSDRVGRLLVDRGVAAGDLVGVCLERSVVMVAVLLGVWKAGAAYVPLDPGFPSERLAFMVADAGLAAVVTSGAGLPVGVDVSGVAVVDVDGDGAELAALPAGPLDGVEPGGLAYVMYTSGSTGRPKGVAVTQANVVNFLLSMAQTPGLAAGDVLLAVTTLSFDISVLELFLPLVVGATVEIASREVAADGRRLGGLIGSSGATVMQATPTTWSMLFDAGWVGAAGLRVLCGGEAMSRDLADRLVGSCRQVWNMFGPTETTVWSTVASVAAGGAGSVPIGRPIAATVCRVLDRAGRLVPPGVAGELFIGGAGVADGYWSRPDLTAERFVADPYDPSGRLYRTGDVARWRSDGQLEFLGRADSQVKVRGHRIELGEIETVLRAQPGIVDAVVVARGAILAAYVVPVDADQPPTVSDLRAGVAGRLPGYMIPNTFITLDHLPLTPNRKIDRNALPDPVVVPEGRRVAPRSETERVVAAVWAEVLEVASVGVEDDFFELGGHSLLATRVVARLGDRLGCEVGVRAVFEASTVAGLAAVIDAGGVGASGRRVLVGVDRSAPLRLSFAQERMWFLEQLVPDSAVYAIPVGVRLRGELDVAALRRALGGLVGRHETLRTRVVVDGDGVARPVIDPPGPVAVDVVDGAGVDSVDAVDRAVARLRSMSHERIDLAVGPVFRAVIVRLGPADHALLLVVHHIAADQWSLDVIGRDLAALYAAETSGVPSGLAPLPFDYVDFAAGQREWLQGPELETQLDFWRGELAGLTPVVLPLDRPRPAVETYAGATVTWPLPVSLLAEVEALARAEGVTFFAVMLASFQALLGRYGDQDDVAVGVPVSNRHDVAMEDVVGNFVNTLVVRSDLGGSPSFRQFVHRVQDTLLEVQAHQDVPFEVLVAELVTARDMSRSPLVQVLFNIHQSPFRFPGLAGLDLEGLWFDRGVAQFDLSVLVTTGQGNIDPHVVVEFNADVFEVGSVERLVEGWRVLLAAAVESPDAAVGVLPVVSGADVDRLLGVWGGSAVGVSAGAGSVVDLVRARVGLGPDVVAVRSGGVALSFAELDALSDRVGRLLVDRGVAAGDLVGVCLERSVVMVAVLLGVWKAGAAYVPLDPGFPSERLAFMVADAGLAAVVTSGAGLPVGVDVSGVAVVDVDGDGAELAALPAGPLDGVEPGGLAYVMYTSGSTGRPKGVAVTQANVVNFLLSMAQTPGLAAGDVLLAVTTLSFDISVLELFLPLVVGATVEIASREVAADGRRLGGLIGSSGATVMQATPTTWSMLFDAGWVGAAGLRVLCGGEAMSRDLADRLVGSCRQVWNMFGPTETTVWSTVASVAAGGAGSVPIGRPIAATVCRVLDRAGRLVPPGVAGELFIGGAGVAARVLEPAGSHRRAVRGRPV